MGISVTFTKQLGAASSNNIATSQSVTGGVAFNLNGSAVSGGVATIDAFVNLTNTAIGRRVALAYSGTDTTFAIAGTNATGNAITDTVVGSSGAAQSNLDFVTVTSIVPVGSITGATAGTNGVGSSTWVLWDWRTNPPMNIGVAVELVTGSVNFTVQHTYDDPNTLNSPVGITYPLAFNMPQITGATATTDAAYTTPIKGTRVLINSGTGEIRVRFMQAGVS